MGRATALWFAWPGRGWPSSLDEEKKFLSDLRAGTSTVDLPQADRDDLTLVLTALRSGISVSRLRRFAPGIRVEKLLAAYESLNQARQDATDAWQRLCHQPTPDTLTSEGPRAELILPSLVRRLYDLEDDTDRLRAQMDEEVAQIQLVQDLAWGVEKKLELKDGPRRALGRQLLNPIDPAWWDHPHYLPRRVTDLTPNRVRCLLGEEQ